MRLRFWSGVFVVFITVVLVSCSGNAPMPLAPSSAVGSNGSQPVGPPWGPETPHFNLEAILRADDGPGFGLVKFRQRNDDLLVIDLITWVRDLKPNTSYLLQRAVDSTLDDVCTSEAWLTLGKGTQPQAITTDENGTGREDLFRNVSAVPVGTTFDIHFRVIEQATSTIALRSGCYQFTTSQ
jgi:hypothetical protein